MMYSYLLIRLTFLFYVTVHSAASIKDAPVPLESPKSQASNAAGLITSEPAFPTITPFQIPLDVLQSLGLPPQIPSAEQQHGGGAWQAPPPNAPAQFGGPRPQAGAAKGSLGNYYGNGGRYGPSGFGMQAGLPFDRSKPPIEANITSITGAGHYTIYQCYNSHLSWRTASSRWLTSSASQQLNSTATVIPTKVIVTNFLNTAVPTITRCDKVVVIPSESVTPISLTFGDPWTSTLLEFPTPAPACGVREHQCEQAHSAYSTKTYSIISSVYSAHFTQSKTGLPGTIVFRNYQPPCGAPLPACPPVDEVANCKLQADKATVYYWPTEPSGDFCAPGQKTIQAQATASGRPKVAVFDSLTITFPSPLVVVPSVTRSVIPPATMVAEESDLIYRPCGYAKDIKLQLNPAHVSSIRTILTPTRTVRHNYTFSTQFGSTTTALPFDFLHLNDAGVPWDAFIGAGNCDFNPGAGQCNSDKKTIRPSQYKPALALNNIALPTVGPNSNTNPSAPVAIDPILAGCSIPVIPGRRVTFVPITASTITAPSITHWGASVSVGSKTSMLGPIQTNGQGAVGSFPANDFYAPGEESYGTIDEFSGDGAIDFGYGGMAAQAPSPPSLQGGRGGAAAKGSWPSMAGGKPAEQAWTPVMAQPGKDAKGSTGKNGTIEVVGTEGVDIVQKNSQGEESEEVARVVVGK